MNNIENLEQKKNELIDFFEELKNSIATKV